MTYLFIGFSDKLLKFYPPFFGDYRSIIVFLLPVE